MHAVLALRNESWALSLGSFYKTFSFSGWFEVVHACNLSTGDTEAGAAVPDPFLLINQRAKQQAPGSPLAH